MRDPERRLRGETGTEVVEWIVVTIILALAFYAVLQVVGGDLMRIYETVRNTVVGLWH
jgi:Flp pilus assembly pilin Flp